MGSLAGAVTEVKFYLGTSEPSWLGRTDVPLFLSARRLRDRRTFPEALGSWALDSGAFTEISMYGRWTVGPRQYAHEVERFARKIGKLAWASPQDWMCEPFITEKTGMTVRQHQDLTIESVITLRAMAKTVHYIPVLQGWTRQDYIDCIELYDAAGISLKDESVVGIGSVCRRQATDEAAEIVTEIASLGIKLHGFGFKTLGLRACGHLLASSDSLAWSIDARYSPPLPTCLGHNHCASCLEYALKWRKSMLGGLSAGISGV